MTRRGMEPPQFRFGERSLNFSLVNDLTGEAQ
jgi:hypothetical protein